MKLHRRTLITVRWLTEVPWFLRNSALLMVRSCSSYSSILCQPSSTSQATSSELTTRNTAPLRSRMSDVQIASPQVLLVVLVSSSTGWYPSFRA